MLRAGNFPGWRRRISNTRRWYGGLRLLGLLGGTHIPGGFTERTPTFPSLGFSRGCGVVGGLLGLNDVLLGIFGLRVLLHVRRIHDGGVHLHACRGELGLVE